MSLKSWLRQQALHFMALTPYFCTLSLPLTASSSKEVPPQNMNAALTSFIESISMGLDKKSRFTLTCVPESLEVPGFPQASQLPALGPIRFSFEQFDLQNSTCQLGFKLMPDLWFSSLTDGEFECFFKGCYLGHHNMGRFISDYFKVLSGGSEVKSGPCFAKLWSGLSSHLLGGVVVNFSSDPKSREDFFALVTQQFQGQIGFQEALEKQNEWMQLELMKKFKTQASEVRDAFQDRRSSAPTLSSQPPSLFQDIEVEEFATKGAVSDGELEVRLRTKSGLLAEVRLEKCVFDGQSKSQKKCLSEQTSGLRIRIMFQPPQGAAVHGQALFFFESR